MNLYFKNVTGNQAWENALNWYTGPNVTVSGTTPPDSPATGDIWVDSDNSNAVTTWDGAAWVAGGQAANAPWVDGVDSTYLAHNLTSATGETSAPFMDGSYAGLGIGTGATGTADFAGIYNFVIIYGGTFTGDGFCNVGSIYGGTFTGDGFITNGSIYGGTFSGDGFYNNGGYIYGGTFTSDGFYNFDPYGGGYGGYIFGGTFSGDGFYNNGGYIYGGTFTGDGFGNNGWIEGGTFTGDGFGNNSGTISGGTFAGMAVVSILRNGLSFYTGTHWLTFANDKAAVLDILGAGLL